MLRGTFENLFAEAVERPDCSALVLAGMVGHLIACTLSAHEAQAARTRASERIVDRARRHIEEHCLEDRFYFSRLFKQKTGLAPSTWGM